MQIPSSIKMIITDFDGIFTDGSVYIDDDRKITRKISFKDVMGVSILVRNGYKVAIISGEENSAIKMIAENFKLEDVYMKIRVKIDVLKQILERHNLSADEVLYIGDDVNDKECLEFVKTKITVPNANKKIKAIENIQITEAFGGDGAFREVVDEIVI